MTTLLFDADILMYTSCQSQEVVKEVKKGYYTWYCSFDSVKKSFFERVNSFMEILDASDYKLFVSDVSNFRKSFYPDYKLHRQKVKRPLVLKPFREYLLKEEGAIVLPELEGDDAIGIYATSDLIKGEKVIVSDDKDLKTIPGYLYKQNEMFYHTEEQADYYHLYQTLIGDQTDGYLGAVGIGPKKAENLLREPVWASVVKGYESVGMTEEQALVQARLARIVRAEDWDFDNQKVKLWTPKKEIND